MNQRKTILIELFGESARSSCPPGIDRTTQSFDGLSAPDITYTGDEVFVTTLNLEAFAPAGCTNDNGFPIFTVFRALIEKVGKIRASAGWKICLPQILVRLH